MLVPNLQSLSLQKNNLSGSIPLSLSRLSGLSYFDLSSNRLSGLFPPILANCTSLNYVAIDNNLLEGQIPPEIGLLKNLSVLSLSANYFTGTVPASFGNLSSLLYLNLGRNRLIGTIPASWKGIQSLHLLSLEHNQLTGFLPEWIWKFKDLHVLSFSNNLFYGEIPTQVSELQALWTTPDPSEAGSQDETLWGSFDALSANAFTSSDKTDATFNFKGQEQNFQLLYLSEGFIDLSNNRLSGRIPSQFGLLKGLRSLNISRNKLTGHISPELGNLPILESLDFSRNALDGRIPQELIKINSLAIFNLSYNNLSGSIPTGRQFNTFDNSSYLGNTKLCGSPLSKTCTSESSLSNRTIGSSVSKGSTAEKRNLIIAATTIASTIIIVVGVAICWMRRSAPSGSANLEMCYFEESLLKVSEKDIYKITEGYSERNIIGSGASSTVYKGQLVNGMTVAIKKLKVEFEAEAQRCFIAECKTLGKIRHRNLVKIMGVISNWDVKILILQFMPSGSLDMHLHGNSTQLDWATRLRIAMGIAEALLYLHEECGIGEIVHCDIKPSNILLDEEFEAHINDFGIARLIDPQLSGSTLSSTLRGSIGYMAPEFAYSQKVSAKGDVYSYGVVLLEIVTRISPNTSNNSYVNVGLNESEAQSSSSSSSSLVEWVGGLYPGRLMHDVVDDALKVNATPLTIHQIDSVVKLALSCTHLTPSKRPSMKEALSTLNGICHYTATEP